MDKKIEILKRKKEELQELKDLPIEDFVDWEGVISIIDDHINTAYKLWDAESLLHEAYNMLDDVHCYDTDTYHEITKYFYGEDDEE